MKTKLAEVSAQGGFVGGLGRHSRRKSPCENKNPLEKSRGFEIIFYGLDCSSQVAMVEIYCGILRLNVEIIAFVPPPPPLNIYEAEP